MNLQDQRILITGASGSLGKQLVYELDHQGIKPICHVRETSDTSYIDSLKLEKRYADLRNREQLAELVAGVDSIIHTAAWVNFRQDRLTQFTGINTIAAIDLFNEASKAGVKRFVHVSTVAAVGGKERRNGKGNGGPRSAQRLINENSQFNLGHLRIPYIMSKQAAETELARLATESKTELITVNPSIIVAPSRTGDDRKTALRKFFKSFIMPDFSNVLNLVDIRDVAPGIIAALDKGTPGERYILAGDNITGKDLALTASVILGKTPHLLRIPRAALKASARMSVIGSRLMGKGKIAFYPDLVKMLDYDWAFSSLKARETLGYQFRSIHETLEDILTGSFTGTYLKPAF
jgi:dihydroflavonol-4-reductase